MDENSKPVDEEIVDEEIVGDEINIEPPPLVDYTPITLDKALERTSEIKQEFISELKETGDGETGSQEMIVRPWVRYFARAIDTSILTLLASPIWPFIVLPVNGYARSYAISLINFFILALIEPFFLSKWGYTPGKWLLNTKVQDGDGGNLSYKKALERVSLVLVYGEGLFIPLISFVTNIHSFSRLTDKGITKWDEKLDVMVSHKKIEGYKVFIAVIILIGIPFCSALLVLAKN